MVDINEMTKCLVARFGGNTMLALIFIHDLCTKCAQLSENILHVYIGV